MTFGLSNPPAPSSEPVIEPSAAPAALGDPRASILDDRSGEIAPLPPRGPASTLPGLAVRPISKPDQKLGPDDPPRCEGIGKNGQRCTQLRVLKTATGFFCRHHRGGVYGKRRRLPVKALETPLDAMKLSSYVALAAARGEMSASDAHAIGAICREFRMAFADAHTVDRVRELEKRLAELTRRA